MVGSSAAPNWYSIRFSVCPLTTPQDARKHRPLLLAHVVLITCGACIIQADDLQVAIHLFYAEGLRFNIFAGSENALVFVVRKITAYETQITLIGSRRSMACLVAELLSALFTRRTGASRIVLSECFFLPKLTPPLGYFVHTIFPRCRVLGVFCRREFEPQS